MSLSGQEISSYLSPPSLYSFFSFFSTSSLSSSSSPLLFSPHTPDSFDPPLVYHYPSQLPFSFFIISNITSTPDLKDPFSYYFVNQTVIPFSVLTKLPQAFHTPNKSCPVIFISCSQSEILFVQKVNHCIQTGVPFDTQLNTHRSLFPSVKIDWRFQSQFQNYVTVSPVEVGFLFFFYFAKQHFFMIRPQRKNHKQRSTSIKTMMIAITTKITPLPSHSQRQSSNKVEEASLAHIFSHLSYS